MDNYSAPIFHRATNTPMAKSATASPISRPICRPRRERGRVSRRISPTSVVGILGDLPLTAGVLLPFLGWELGPPTEIAAVVASWEP